MLNHRKVQPNVRNSGITFAENHMYATEFYILLHNNVEDCNVVSCDILLVGIWPYQAISSVETAISNFQTHFLKWLPINIKCKAGRLT